MSRRLVAAVLLVGAVASATAGSVAAGKGGGGGSPAPTTTTTFKMVPLDSADGVVHWGQKITFEVKSSVTTKPYVSVECKQAGATVYASSAGFYPDYPWPSSQIYELRSSYWTGGSADCVANAYYAAGRNKFPTLATLAFTVQA